MINGSKSGGAYSYPVRAEDSIRFMMVHELTHSAMFRLLAAKPDCIPENLRAEPVIKLVKSYHGYQGPLCQYAEGLANLVAIEDSSTSGRPGARNYAALFLAKFLSYAALMMEQDPNGSPIEKSLRVFPALKPEEALMREVAGRISSYDADPCHSLFSNPFLDSPGHIIGTAKVLEFLFQGFSLPMVLTFPFVNDKVIP